MQTGEDLPKSSADIAMLAGELRTTTGRLMRRLRAEFRFPMTQASVLNRLLREGPQSIGQLATAELVRPQSMSQTLADLEADGLVARGPDETDGRRAKIEITDAGRTALFADRASREGWLAQAMESFTQEELETLHRAVELMRRLIEL